MVRLHNTTYINAPSFMPSAQVSQHRLNLALVVHVLQVLPRARKLTPVFPWMGSLRPGSQSKVTGTLILFTTVGGDNPTVNKVGIDWWSTYSRLSDFRPLLDSWNLRILAGLGVSQY